MQKSEKIKSESYASRPHPWLLQVRLEKLRKTIFPHQNPKTLFEKSSFFYIGQNAWANSTGNSHAVSYRGTIPARRSLDCRELTRPGAFYVVWPLAYV